MIGEPALEPARAVLADASVESFNRVAAASALRLAVERHPELRDRVVSMLVEQLRAWPDQDDVVNGFLIDYLVELRVVEAAPLMQAAFEAGLADPDIRGDWEDLQIELGLLEKRLTKPRPPAWLAKVQPPRPSAPQTSAKTMSGGERQKEAQGAKEGKAQPEEVVGRRGHVLRGGQSASGTMCDPADDDHRAPRDASACFSPARRGRACRAAMPPGPRLAAPRRWRPPRAGCGR